MIIKLVIEGFSGKRALGFLLKTELCQKCSKFRMQFFRYGKKHIFLKPSSGDLLLKEKQKKPVVSLNHGVSIIQESPTTASLAQVAKALNGPDASLFCPDAGSIRGGGRSIFFFLYTFQNPRYLFIFVSL